MRTLLGVSLCAVLGTTLFAQHASVGGPRTYGSTSGFGNILFPGTGGPPPVRQGGIGIVGGITDPTFAARYGRTVGGIVGLPGAYQRGTGRTQTIIVPYGVPVYGGAGYLAQPEPPNVTVVVPPQQTPSVIVNQNFVGETARPVVRDYSDAELPETLSNNSGMPSGFYQAPVRPPADVPAQRASGDTKATIYLLAFKDHSIYSAIAYWVEGNTLNYVTPQGAHNQATLDLLDREFSEQLNRERGLDFALRSSAGK
jgi:hypothetical protein